MCSRWTCPRVPTRTNPYGARVCMKYTYFTRKGITKTHGCPNAVAVIIIIITEIVIRNRSEYSTQRVAYSRVIRFTFRKINVSFVTFNYKRVCTNSTILTVCCLRICQNTAYLRTMPKDHYNVQQPKASLFETRKMLAIFLKSI